MISCLRCGLDRHRETEMDLDAICRSCFLALERRDKSVPIWLGQVVEKLRARSADKSLSSERREAFAFAANELAVLSSCNLGRTRYFVESTMVFQADAALGLVRTLQEYATKAQRDDAMPRSSEGFRSLDVLLEEL